MKSLLKFSLAFTLALILVAPASSASASTWRWNRDAGAKARGDYGRNTPKVRNHRTRSYSSGRFAYRPTIWNCRSLSCEPSSKAAGKTGD